AVTADVGARRSAEEADALPPQLHRERHLLERAAARIERPARDFRGAREAQGEIDAAGFLADGDGDAPRVGDGGRTWKVRRRVAHHVAAAVLDRPLLCGLRHHDVAAGREAAESVLPVLVGADEWPGTDRHEPP